MVALKGKGSLQALFKSYAGGKSVMNSRDVDELVRELGCAPSEKELKDFKRKVGPSCGVDQIQEFVGTLGHPEDNEETFMKFFRFYDPQNTGNISKGTLEKLLAHVGETMNAEELKAFFTKTCDFGDNIPYKKLVTKLLTR